MADILAVQGRRPVLCNGDFGIGWLCPLRNVGEAHHILSGRHVLHRGTAVKFLAVKGPPGFFRAVDYDGDCPGLRGYYIWRLDGCSFTSARDRNVRSCSRRRNVRAYLFSRERRCLDTTSQQEKSNKQAE
jgi:hypothetical protein